MAEAQKSVVIAEIGAAHGVRGEVRVKAHTADPLAIADYGPLFDGKGRVFKVKSLRHLKDDMLVVAFEGLTDRTAAEKLTRTGLHVDRSVLPPPDEDEFYHADLIGLAAVDAAGKPLGTVAAIHNFGAGDIIEIAPAHGPTLMLPFTDAVVPVVDLAGGRVVIEMPGEIEGEEPDQA